MDKGGMPGVDAIRAKGFWIANRYLILRRFTQLVLLGLFLAGPLFGVWIIKGNIASSMTLEILPLTDPLVAMQSLLAGQTLEQVAITGVAIVVVFYLLVGGRVFCSWVCPINIITDAAEWVRRKLNLKGGAHFSRSTRYWFLGAILLLSYFTGTIAYELINPVSMVYRGLVFGMGLAWGVVAGVFLLDLFVARNAWCGHLCPVGAFYSLLGKVAILRVTADKRADCDDCMDCYAICPESQVIKPALKGADKNLGPVIMAGQCNNCGRCIDVCAKDVFHFTNRFNNRLPESTGVQQQREVSS